MEPHSEILQELQLLHSPLAHAPRALNPAVPAGYFENAAALFVSGVLAQEEADIIPVFSTVSVAAGELPTGYFESAAATFLSGVLAQDAADPQLSFAPSPTPAGPVPAGYFETSAATFVSGVRAQEQADVQLPFTAAEMPGPALPESYFATSVSTFVAGVLAQEGDDISLSVPLSRLPAGEVPANFFEQFPAQITQLAKANAFVESLPKPAVEMPPAHYFEQLPAQVLRRIQAEERTVAQPAGKPRKTIALPFFRWAAAAALIVGISFGMYRAGAPDAGPQAVNRALAAIPQSELQAYVTQNLDEFETELLEKGADVTQMAPETPHLKQTDIESYLQAEGLL